MAQDVSPESYKWLRNSGLMLVAILPVVYLVKIQNINDDIIAFGTLSWIFAVLIKTLSYQILIKKYLHSKLPVKWISLANGINSGVTELGVSLIIFSFLSRLSFLEVISFGVGIGSVEAFIITAISDPLKGTALEDGIKKLDQSIQQQSHKARFGIEVILPIFERMLATIIHISN